MYNYIFFDFAMRIRERLMVLMRYVSDTPASKDAHHECSFPTIGFDSILRVMSYLDNQSLYQVSCTSN